MNTSRTLKKKLFPSLPGYTHKNTRHLEFYRQYSKKQWL